VRHVYAFAALIAVLAGLALAAPAGHAESLTVSASAYVGQANWQKIAQGAKFPVYRPRQTLGLELEGPLLNSSGCLTAAWGDARSSKGPHFGIYEPGDSTQCGQPGVATEVATVPINGIEAHVLVECPAWPRCTRSNGQTNGAFVIFVPERGPAHYAIQLQSTHVGFSDFVKIARSFTKVP
jgi:hypothetical protein